MDSVHVCDEALREGYYILSRLTNWLDAALEHFFITYKNAILRR